MNNNLFLRGPVRSGKSTLINATLKGFTGTLAGFSVGRIWNGPSIWGYMLIRPGESQVDFKLCQLSSLELSRVFIKPVRPEVQIDSTPACAVAAGNNILKESLLNTASNPLSAPRSFDPSPFSNVLDSALEMISATTSKALPSSNLIVLDEIGGEELNIDLFYQVLLDILSSPVPVVGVLKQFPSKNVLAERYKKIETLLEDSIMDIDDLSG